MAFDTLDFHTGNVLKRHCYLNALSFLRANRNQPWRMVHGIVHPDVGEAAGQAMAHAWTEIEHEGRTVVYDPSIALLVEGDVYRARLGVEHAVGYTLEEVERLVQGTGHCGPWDEAVSAALHAVRRGAGKTPRT